MIYESLYNSPTGLKTVGFAVSAYLLIAHAVGLAKPAVVKAGLKALPRHQMAGRILIGLVAVWCYGLFQGLNLGIVEIPQMSMGEFYHLRGALTWAVVIGAVLVMYYAEEFLSVRALGCLMLLAACVILDAAFLKEPASRLLVVIFAYAMVFKGLFFIGMPYLFRDGVDWVIASDKCWRPAMIAGLAYGVAVLIATMIWY